MTKLKNSTPINGIDTTRLGELVDTVRRDAGEGLARFAVRTEWKGGARSDSHVSHWELGGRRLAKDFTIAIDEPVELLGTNRHPNPQEVLLAAVNACIMATYVAACSVNGITLERIEIETAGELDLRGFLAIDGKVKPGYDRIDLTVRIAGDGTPEQFEQVHTHVQRTSPNFYNMSQPVRVVPTLVVE